MATLEGSTISSTYKDLLQVDNGNVGVDGTLRDVEDGEGTASKLQISTVGVKSTGTLEVTGDTTLTGALSIGGVTLAATGTELNYCDGVTSAIQAQMDLKAPLASPTLTSPVLNTGVSGTAVLDSDTMSGASATTLASSESIKAYVDAEIGTHDAIDLEGTTLATNVVTSSLTTIGTIGTGEWAATDVAVAHGGTGASTAQAAINALTGASSSITDNYILTKNSSHNAVWAAPVAGLIGDTGETGETGDAGADGATWTSGTSLPTVVNGDFFLKTDEKKIYKGESDSWVLKVTIVDGTDGTDGADGTDGTDGADAWTSGASDPSGGSDGDFYFQTTENEVWKNTAGSWGVIADVDGEQGIQGIQGETGAAGATGITGTPADNQVAVWKTSNSIEGTSGLVFDSTGLGIGTSSPKRHIQIYNSSAASTYLQITNSSTGSASDGDGFQIGLGGDGTAYVNQREDLDLVFNTANTERMRIASGGDCQWYNTSGVAKMAWDASAVALGIGTASPSETLEVSSQSHDGGVLISAGNNNQSTKLAIESKSSDGTVQNYYFDVSRSSQSFCIVDGTAVLQRLTIDTDGRVTVKKASNSEVKVLDIVSGDVAIDMNDANNFSLAIDDGFELKNPTNMTAGQSGCIVMTMDSGAAYTWTFESSSVWKFEEGDVPDLSLTVSQVDTLAYYVADASNIHAVLLKDMSN